MDPMSEEQVDYGEDEYGGSQKLQLQGSGGAIPALVEEEELMGEDDEYDDLYNDVNVGEGFMHTLQPQPEPKPIVAFGNGGGSLNQKTDVPSMAGSQHNVSIPGVGVEGKDSRPPGSGFRGSEQNPSGLEEGTGDYPVGVSQKVNPRVMDMAPETSHMGDVGFRGGSSAPMPPKVGSLPLPTPSSNRAGLVGSRPMVNNEDSRPPVAGSVENNGQTMLFVGELQWWTTDSELESVLSQYGRVKEIKFFDERASGKSKGYCQVEFYDSAAASACKEGMSGHVFNGRACVVAFASPQTLRQMGAAYLNRTQAQGQSQPQGRRVMNDGMGRGGGGGGMNYQGGDGGGGGRNFGRGGWGGRGGQGLLNRGQGGGGAMRGRGFVGGAKGMMGPAAGGPYGQGLAGAAAALGGPAGGLMHPQSMMAAGFDPTTYMGRGGPYGGFSAPAFPGMMPSFQAVNAVLPGVAPHVNPAFFGRGMSANGMGMMGSTGMEGGMWGDASMGGWMGEEHGRRTRESSYVGDDGASDYGGYGEVNNERGGRSNASREKERGPERDWSERRQRDEKEQDWERSDRERHKEEKDGYRDHRPRDRDWDNEDDYDRGQSSSRSRRMMQEDDHRSRSRDADYGKRRRLPSE